MSDGFSLDWLRLREEADRRARSRALARRFAEAVRAKAGDQTAVVVDLGAGSGANFRALAPLIAASQDWRLIDRDPALLARQAAEIAQWGRAQGYRVAHGSRIATVAAGDAQWRAQSVALDLVSLERLPFAGVHGVTCSALLDLVSEAWLETLARLVAAWRLPFLAALNTDGRREWQPAHEADAIVAAAFARHHRGDKGFGPALGGAAGTAVAARFAARGYAIVTEPSDWRLGPESRFVLEMLIEDTARAAVEADPGAASTVADWRGARRSQCVNGMLRLVVGHADILAVAAAKDT